MFSEIGAHMGKARGAHTTRGGCVQLLCGEHERYQKNARSKKNHQKKKSSGNKAEREGQERRRRKTIGIEGRRMGMVVVVVVGEGRGLVLGWYSRGTSFACQSNKTHKRAGCHKHSLHRGGGGEETKRTVALVSFRGEKEGENAGGWLFVSFPLIVFPQRGSSLLQI